MMGLQLGFIELSLIGFLDAPAYIIDAVVEEKGFDLERPVFDETLMGNGVFDDVDHFMIDAASSEAVEVDLSAGRKIAMDRVSYFIEVEPHEHGADAQTMIAVKMADEDARHAGRRYVGKDELPLSTFARIKEESFIIPPKEISAMIAEAGRLLA